MDAKTKAIATNHNQWRNAHLLPLKIPIGTLELKTLEKYCDAGLEAVRGGLKLHMIY